MDVHLHASTLEASYAIVEPTFGIALAFAALTVCGSPHGKLVGVRTYALAKVAAVEVRIEHHLAAEVIEAERVFVRNCCELVFNHPVGRFYPSFDLILLTEGRWRGHRR